MSEQEIINRLKDKIENGKIIKKLKNAEVIIIIILYLSKKIIEQRCKEWYAMRYTNIGASEMGCFVFQDDKSFFAKILLDRYVKEPMNEIGKFNCNFGNFFEDATRKSFEDINGIKVIETGSIEGFCKGQRFSPDGLAVLPDGTPVVCEFKTPVARDYKKDYISETYREQVYTSLLSLYKKYKIKAIGMFMDCFLKPCNLVNLTMKDLTFNSDRQEFYLKANQSSFNVKKPLYIGYVKVIPKNDDEFQTFLNSTSTSEVIADDTCICPVGDCDCPVKERKNFSNTVVDLLDVTLLCRLFKHIYGIKEEQDAIGLQLLDNKISDEEKEKLTSKLESMQSFTMCYEGFKCGAPTTPGYYVGYKVFQVNPVLIELDKSKIVEDIEYRSGCITHMKKMMDIFNEHLEEYPETKFNKTVFKKWFKKAANGTNDCRLVDLRSLKIALLNNDLS